MTKLGIYTLSFILSVSSFNSFAQGVQEKINEDIFYPECIKTKIETAGVFSGGDNAPFWFTNNNHGIGSEHKNNGYLRVGTFAEDTFFKGKLRVSAGADILASYNLQTDFYFHQLYADFKYRSLGLSIGSKERNTLFRNKDLSTGGLTLSGNSRPIPQILAGFPNFVNIPLTNKWLQVQGGISYGWFLDNKYKVRHAGDGSYAKDVYYHRKYAYFKVEKNTPWNFILGLEMDTQWGGKMYRNNKIYTKSPGNLKNFFKVLVPMAGGGDANGTDQVNILGNVYGSWHFIFNYKTKDYSIKAYHEHFFEDHSGIIFKNMPDGIYGLEFNLNRKAPISTILFEYIHTKNQSGPFLWDESNEIPIQVSAGDNYYNQVDYVSLTHYGHVLGNPLLTSSIYNNGQTLLVLNTRISAFHGGISGYISNNLQYRTLLTYSRSWGTPLLPSTHIRNQFSGLLEASYTPPKLDGWFFSGAIAYDDAKSMVGDNWGLQFKIAKSFNIR